MIKGDRLKELRKSKNLTQTDLGKILGVEKAAVSTYENETRSPSLDILIKLFLYFDVSSDYLLGNDKVVVIENNGKKQIMTKEEVELINELKKDKFIYNILLKDPKRGVELIKNEIG